MTIFIAGRGAANAALTGLPASAACERGHAASSAMHPHKRTHPTGGKQASAPAKLL